jgi:hypothetical protein
MIHDTTPIFDGSRANGNVPFFRGQLLHHMDKKQKTIHGDTLRM